MSIRSAAAAALILASAAAQAAAPQYAGTFASSSTTGTVLADSGPWGTPASWSLWTFNAPWAADVSITVAPQGSELDAVIAVFYGTETDVEHYVDLFSGGLASTLFWVDPAEELVVVFMTQLMPSRTFNFRGQLENIIYAALR